MKYLVSHQNTEAGPYTLDEIVQKVQARELELFDYIFDEKSKDWVLLMEHAELASRLKSKKPTRPPKTAAPAAETETTPVREASPHTISEWFILKGENRFGPFGYADVIKMLQQKVVFGFDFVWHSGLKDWTRLSELSEFGEDQVRKFFGEAGKKKSEVFSERKFKRKSYAGPVMVHDNLTLWKAEGFEISRGGVGITMSNTVVVPGQRLFLHFKKHESWPSFNAVCEVVSKKYVNDKSPVEYGLRFVSLSQEVQDEFYKKVA